MNFISKLITVLFLIIIPFTAFARRGPAGGIDQYFSLGFAILFLYLIYRVTKKPKVEEEELELEEQ